MHAAGGTDSSGSLDSLWEDQTKPAPPPSLDAKTSTRTLQQPDLSAAAPLCTVDDFKKSSLIVEGGWPGVGPFKSQPDNEYAFADAQNNKLRIQVLEGQVAQARLNLVKTKPAQSDLLDIQLDTDFLLESLGAKPSSIAEFNSLIQKERAQIWSQKHPVEVCAGHYLVSIGRCAEQPDQPPGYLVEINNQDANSSVLKEQSSLSVASAVVPQAIAPDAISASATTNAGRNADNQSSTMSTKLKSGDNSNDAGVNAGADICTGTGIGLKSTSAGKPIVPPGNAHTAAQSPAPKPNVKADELKNSFANVIRDWQSIKREAVRQKQLSSLGNALSGKALARQSDAIKWLSANKKSYDLTAKLIGIDRCTEVVPGKKYIVCATVREQSKYIDDKSGQVLKEETNTYKVNYTMENLKDRWYITDSSVTDAGRTSATSHVPLHSASSRSTSAR